MANAKREKISLFQLMERYATEDAAKQQFIEWRWPEGITCPHCDGLRIRETVHKMPYYCSACRKRFSLKIGTIMAGSNLSYRTWLVAVYLLTTNTKGVASTRLGSELTITQKSAWHLSQRIRKALDNSSSHATIHAAAEIDETHIGGKHRKHWDRGATGKQIVIGFKERGGRNVRASRIQRVATGRLSA